ncbi:MULTISPECIES: cell division protein DedD [Pseudomonadati]|uniref:Cell division protein DedD n=1 Tax=Shewanella aestuarii TaxID=1028752 RepID=A0ABT0L415_9GAMM|nr:cell division protein DedD [Shewanella aestuarii]MCL1118162.1 cell division protein DedD [Shewanella aestuarii]GGN81536.1 cell division protein DedD [Shewanella aestuarii]
MKRQFQNRLVGTIVLVALGVIFLPDLLDGKKAKVVEEFTEIPLRPANQIQNNDAPQEFEVLEIASVDIKTDSNQTKLNEKNADIVPLGDIDAATLSKPVAKSETVKEVVVAKTPPVKEPAKKDIEKPQTQTQKSIIKSGYTLQLGGFNNAKNVEALIAQLRLSGYTAYTLPTKPVEGKLTRVFVGPEVSKQKLESRQAAITKLTGLKGKIVIYDPMDK